MACLWAGVTPGRPTYVRDRLTTTLADARALVQRWPKDHPEAGGNETTYEELALDLTIVVNAASRATSTATSSNVAPD